MTSSCRVTMSLPESTRNFTRTLRTADAGPGKGPSPWGRLNTSAVRHRKEPSLRKRRIHHVTASRYSAMFSLFFLSESEWRNLTLSGPSSMFTNLYGFVKQQHLPLSCKEGRAKNLFKTILRDFNSLHAAKQSARETLFTGLVYTNSNCNNNKTRSSSFSKFWQSRRVLHGCSATYSITQVIK